MTRVASLVILTSMFAGGWLTAAGRDSCQDCYRAKVWTIPSEQWRANRPAQEPFPEVGSPSLGDRADLGIAFSGGGTRSATATLGELRGLQQNGWLDRVSYIASVSGGTWAAASYVYSRIPTDELLGTFQTPAELRLHTIDDPRGRMAKAITESGLFAAGVWEALDLAEPKIPVDQLNEVYDAIRSLLHGADAERRDKTFRRMIDKVFVKPLADESLNQPLLWDDRQLRWMGLIGANDNIPRRIPLPQNKPFLIAGGALVRMNGDDDPDIIPVEYTPLYSGIRQQFGRNIGGSYIESWAFDRPVVALENKIASVERPDSKGFFSLGDLMASSGAAPQLAMLMGVGGPAAKFTKLGATLFPAFHHVPIQRIDSPDGRSMEVVGQSAPYPHGDGGFTDYVGIMPLVARGVKNIIAFVNSDNDPERESSLKSYFVPLGRAVDGDKGNNVLFDTDVKTITDQLWKLEKEGKPPVACYSDQTVLSNHHYNVRGYEGLNICWVYNMRARGWEGRLTKGVQEALFPKDYPRGPRAGSFERFPHFRTFYEDVPRVIKLRADQVNAFANFTSWLVTDERSACHMKATLKVNLPQPPGVVCVTK